MRETLWIVGCAFVVAACGGAGEGGAAAPEPASKIARIHRMRCGDCHVRVEPGERTRAQLESALARHHKRVHLTDDQWGEMIDYLAAQVDAGTTAPQGDAQ